jgi:hypothetical protein
MQMSITRDREGFLKRVLPERKVARGCEPDGRGMKKVFPPQPLQKTASSRLALEQRVQVFMRNKATPRQTESELGHQHKDIRKHSKKSIIGKRGSERQHAFSIPSVSSCSKFQGTGGNVTRKSPVSSATK